MKFTYCFGFLAPCFTIAGLILVGSAVALMLVFPLILQQQVEQRVPIRAGSLTFQQLMNPTIPLFKDIYFFNLTNLEQFEAGEKPVLEEVGPYSYAETRAKTFISLSPDGELLQYNQTRIFKFNQETTRTGLQENDTICTINIALVAAVAQLEEAMEENNLLINILGDSILRDIFRRADAKIYICQPASNLAWEYTDDLIVSLNRNIALRATGMNYPRTFVNININNSVNDSCPSVIFTGVNNLTNIGQFTQWKGNVESVDVWPNEMGANDINGTEGLIFHPFLTEDEFLEVFSDDAFRVFALVYADSLELMGIGVFRYELVNSTFESAFTNPENARWGSWNPDGLFFLGPTQDPPVPVYGSKPHFLDGDPVLREKVCGMNPNRSLHETALHLDPLTGANVEFAIKLQINLQVNQSSSYDQLENINGTVYFPILYFSEHSVLNSEFADLLLSNGLEVAYLSLTIVPIGFGMLLAFGGICFIIAVISLALCIRGACLSCKHTFSHQVEEHSINTSPQDIVLNPVSTRWRKT